MQTDNLSEVMRLVNAKADSRIERYTAKFVIALSIMLFSTTTATYAQSSQTDDLAPPPMRLVSKGERSQLDASIDPKRRVELALMLMAGRMKRAETLKAGEDFENMFLELGGFHGLMDNTLDYLERENRRRGKVLNYFKKYEMGLRGFTPRLELIRRDLPTRYEPYIKTLLRYLRDARSKAIEPFYGDSVVSRR